MESFSIHSGADSSGDKNRGTVVVSWFLPCSIKASVVTLQFCSSVKHAPSVFYETHSLESTESQGNFHNREKGGKLDCLLH